MMMMMMTAHSTLSSLPTDLRNQAFQKNSHGDFKIIFLASAKKKRVDSNVGKRFHNNSLLFIATLYCYRNNAAASHNGPIRGELSTT